RFLARLDDDWGVQAFADEFRKQPRREWDSSFGIVRNARVIPLIGDLLFKEEEYVIVEDLGLPATQEVATHGVIKTLKHSSQFMPDVGLWGRQLEDASSKDR